MLITPKRGKWLLLPFLLLLILSSCQKEVSIPTNQPQANIRLPQTPQEQAIVDKIRIVQEILKKIYADPRVTREVNAAIKSGYYSEEFVKLKDLLNPQTSELYLSQKFRSMNVEAAIFASSFREEYNRLYGGENPEGRSTGDYFEDHGITIYFPYSENFTDPRPSEITLVAADRDADEGPGNQPNGTNSDGTTKYVDVIVNDDYADRMPVHIVGVVDKFWDIGEVDSVPPPTTSVDRVFHGFSRLTKNLDRLISFTGNGGGSEMKIARISGYLQVQNQQVTNFAGDVVTVNYSRKDIRKDKWKRVVYSLGP